MNSNETLHWLSEKEPAKLDDLFREARACAVRYVGSKVYFRGIIEYSNHCVKDCYYCGIRKSNVNVTRFAMDKAEILECAKASLEMGYGSIVLQSGERRDEASVRFVEEVLQEIKAATSGKLGITLSLGEQSPETYERWFKAGAHRYLLRIETSSPELYGRLHPEDHSYETRRECLRALRRTGYQVGTGVMIGLPFQTHRDLIDDLLFFKNEDVDMIGMGPYIPHKDAPLVPTAHDPAENLRLGLVMIALTRLFLKDVNIAASTALQTLDPSGREKGVRAGANIIMPNVTPTDYRKFYQLYDNKPCLDENARQCKGCLEHRVQAAGAKIGYGEWGDSVHFLKKRNASKEGVP
ncbi:MAG: [FeFe] hydrogenase H-cluster radical SAM maturase HydE [Candidatus Omnitrophota bacterium]